MSMVNGTSAIQMFKNPATKQIAVKAPENKKFQDSVRGIQGAVWSEPMKMWVIPYGAIDEVEYHLERIFGWSRPAKKEKSEPEKKEPAKVIPMPTAQPQPQMAEAAPPQNQPPKETSKTPDSENKKSEKTEDSPEGASADTAGQQPDPAPAMPKNWREKLGEAYKEAKAHNNSTDMAIIAYIGAQAKNDPVLQKNIEQPWKTYPRMYEYLEKKILAFAKQQDMQKRKGMMCVHVEDDACYKWAVEYFGVDDKAKIEEEERKAAEEKAKRAKQKAEFEEKEKKRKERAAKKAAKEAAKKEKESEAPAAVTPATPEEDEEEKAEKILTSTAQPENPEEEEAASDEEDESFDGQLSLM